MKYFSEKLTLSAALIEEWVTKKNVKLNQKKTECLIIGTKHDITKYVGLKSVSINNEEIEDQLKNAHLSTTNWRKHSS